MNKFLLKIVNKWVWPKIKNTVLDKIQNNEYQEKIVNKLEEKIPDVDGFSKRKQKALLNKIYDAVQEAAAEFVEDLDLVNLVDDKKD